MIYREKCFQVNKQIIILIARGWGTMRGERFKTQSVMNGSCHDLLSGSHGPRDSDTKKPCFFSEHPDALVP